MCYVLSKLYLYFISCAQSLQSCPTLCSSIDWSPLGFSVHGILQARILEWAAMPSSRGSSRHTDRTRISWEENCISNLPLNWLNLSTLSIRAPSNSCYHCLQCFSLWFFWKPHAPLFAVSVVLLSPNTQSKRGGNFLHGYPAVTPAAAVPRYALTPCCRRRKC